MLHRVRQKLSHGKEKITSTLQEEENKTSMNEDMKPLDAGKTQLLLLLILGAHVIVAFGLFIIGHTHKSFSCLASGVHALVSGGSSVLTILAIQGQGTTSTSSRSFLSRFVLISLMFICGLLFLCAWEVFRECFQHLLTGGVTAMFSWPAALLLLTCSGVNFIVPVYEQRVAVTSAYESLARSAFLKEPGPLPPALALGALAVSERLWPLADPIISLIICLMTVPACYHLVRMGVDIVQDLSQPPTFLRGPLQK